MKRRVFQSQISVCQVCDFLAVHRSLQSRSLCRISQYTAQSRTFTTRRLLSRRSRPTTTPLPTTLQSISPLPAHRNADGVAQSVQVHKQSSIESELREITNRRDNILSSSSIPSEQEVKETLSRCDVVADSLVEPLDQVVGIQDGSAASALLSVDVPSSAKPAAKSQKFSLLAQNYIDNLSNIAHSLLVHPSVFITPDILRLYVSLQSRLRKPETFPQIFSLYSSKPVPDERFSPAKYIDQSPSKAANAVNSSVADLALQTAIETKQLLVAMEVIETTYARSAFRRAKFIRKGLFPATGLAFAPVAAYALAGQLSTYQTTMDPIVATNMAFAGILAYMGFTATIGIVAITTANDQMDRVTWAQGMPLRERWLREEERAAIDKVAGAWGFREKWRRGEEEGEEWDGLREWIGRRGMILDRVDLMEGME